MKMNTLKKIKTFIILNTICLNVYGQNLPTKYIEFYQNLETETYENKFKILDKAIDKNPKEPWYYWMYANVYVQKNDENKALYYYEKALIIDSNFSEGHASLARFLYNADSKNLEKALSHINIAIKAEPNTSYYHIDRAEIYLKLKKYELAIEDANFELTIVDSDPNTAYQIIVKALYEQNKKNELFDLLRKYDLSQNPMFGTDFGILLGDIYYEMGEKEKACNCFRAVAEPYEMMGEKLPEEIDKKIKACK
jgi:tetratricopeptide (TPR) repeat protein